MSTSSVPHTIVSRQSSEQCGAVYARVSTTDQADKGYSLPTQIEACQTLARQEGYSVPESYVFVDDYTGTSLNRPQLTKLRDLVHQRLVQAVICYDVDRLSRKMAHQLLLDDEFAQAGVALLFVTMPATEKTPESQLFSHMRGTIAEYERAKILERTMRGLRGRAQEGYPPASGIPLGYRYVRNTGKDGKVLRGGHYVIVPEQAALVQRIFQWYVVDGLTMHAIAVRLMREGIPTPQQWRGKGASERRGWCVPSVRTILLSETYTGMYHYGKKQSQPGKRNPDKKTRWRDVPREAWIPVPVPSIIDRDLFDAAQAKVQQNTQQSRRNRKHEYLLVGGRLKCGTCGRTMTGFASQRGTRRYRCCHHPHQAYETPHSPRSCLALPVETYVWARVERILEHPELIAREVEQLQQDTTAHEGTLARDRHVLERQLAQGEKDLKRWEALYLAEGLTIAEFKEKKVALDAQRHSLEQELARLDEQRQALEQAALEADALVDYCQRVRAELHHFTMAEKHLALDALNIQVTWYPDRDPVITGRIPLSNIENIDVNAPWCILALPSRPQSAGHGCSLEYAGTRASAHCCTRR